MQFLKKEAINTGSDIISGLTQQKPIKEVLRDRSLQIVDDLKDMASDKIKNKIREMTGSGCRNRKNKCTLVKTKKSKGIKRKQSPIKSHSKKYRDLIYSLKK